MDDNIKRFKERFGNKIGISDDILKLLFENNIDVFDNAVGREILIEIIVLIAECIKKILDGDSTAKESLIILQEVFIRWCSIIREHMKNDESFCFDDLGGLNNEEKTILRKKLSSTEFNSYAHILLNLDKFFYAFNTETGKLIIDDIDKNIDKKVKQVWENSFNNSDKIYYDVYRSIKSALMQKTTLRVRTLAEAIKIIKRR